MIEQGYLNPDYVDSLGKFGIPLELPRSKGWILKRRIPGLSDFDAMGPYPLFCCQNWPQLHADLAALRNGLVSLSLVTDPFGEYDKEYLQHVFTDMVIPFKAHFIVDLSQSPETFVCEHHQRNIQKAREKVEVERCDVPIDYLNEWISLYENLIDRHNITGIRAFSRESFAKQLTTPGIEAFRAFVGGSTVSMLLWYIQENRAYYHLGASSAQGYDMGASFALFWMAIEYFASMGLRWIDLMAGAGVNSNANDGLTRFKRGWATGTRMTYFCGRIFNQTRYSEIVKKKEIPSTDYFPAYRKGEFQ